MSISPEDLADLAKQLVDHPPVALAEVRHRGSMSRAYYAAFHALRLRIDKVKGGRFVPPANAHSFIPRVLRRTGERHLTKLASSADALREMREIADYELDRTVSQADAEAQLERLARLLSSLESLPDAKLTTLRS